MKRYNIKTVTGSSYQIKEKQNGELSVNMMRTVPNPYVNPLRYLQGWQKCEITPWPPVVGHSLQIVRPNIPWGQGQITKTSSVVEVQVAQKAVKNA